MRDSHGVWLVGVDLASSTGLRHGGVLPSLLEATLTCCNRPSHRQGPHWLFRPFLTTLVRAFSEAAVEEGPRERGRDLHG